MRSLVMVKAAMPDRTWSRWRNDRIEVGGDDFGLETEDVAHGAGEIHVVAIWVLRRRRGIRPGRRRVGADGELASLVTDSGSSAAMVSSFSTELTS